MSEWVPPRRICLDKFTPAERAIYDAIGAVEAMPADVRLTEAQTLLSQAKDKVADYVDEQLAAQSSKHDWRFVASHGSDTPHQSLDEYHQCTRCSCLRHDYRHNGGQTSPNYPMYYLQGACVAGPTNEPDCPPKT